MLLHDFLKCFGEDLFYVVIWIESEDDEPIWHGWSIDIPWIYADLRLAQADLDNDLSPVSFRSNLGGKYDNRPGLVITLAN